ncbi:MAG: hypothetical protein MJK14_15045 [Rivularia sp. ALOHA_DT_140]|nr:hypothetical protein [Rivularia sp. ALOHA_DT_140]
MKFPRMRRVFAALILSILLLTTACAQKAPGRFDQVQQESTQQKRGQAVAKDATQGSKFNKFFPAASDGYQRVFTQEKKGFAQAKLKKDGKEVAAISVNDTTSNPSAAAKFDKSSKTISGYPAIEKAKQTAVLVENRYQVKIISRDPAFTAADREAWLKKFNLSGLARVKA